MIPLPSLAPSLEAIVTALEAHSVEEQANWMHGLGRKEMARLYDWGGPVPLDHFLGGDGEVIVHEGQNSLLPGIDRFEKHMVLRSGVMQGYNKQGFGWFTGPGHFLLREEDGTTVFDYNQVPSDAPQGWPAVRANTGFPDLLVYGHMVDVMHRVSSRMTVGKAFKKGKEVGAYFLLLRR